MTMTINTATTTFSYWLNGQFYWCYSIWGLVSQSRTFSTHKIGAWPFSGLMPFLLPNQQHQSTEALNQLLNTSIKLLKGKHYLLQQTNKSHQTWFGHEPVAADAQIRPTRVWKLILHAVSHTALHSQTSVVLAVSLIGHRHCFLHQRNVIVTCCMMS